MHYIILGLYALGLTCGVYTGDITPRLALENQYFFYNTQNQFNQPVGNDLYANGILSVKTEITVFKFVDFYFGTRGWYGQHSFTSGGMYWGMAIRPLKNISVYFRHDSIHAFDNAWNTGQLTVNAKGWSQDQLGVMLHINFDESGKTNLINYFWGKK